MSDSQETGTFVKSKVEIKECQRLIKHVRSPRKRTTMASLHPHIPKLDKDETDIQ